MLVLATAGAPHHRNNREKAPMAAPSDGGKKNHALTHQILEYLSEHRGEEVYLRQLARAVGHETRLASLQAAMLRLSRNPGYDVKVLTSGQAWVFNGAASQNGSGPAEPYGKGDLFEVIGQANDGRTILQAADGTLWIAGRI